MKKIKISAGGQPIRPDDFELVQEQALRSTFELIKGLCDDQTRAIVSGLGITNNGNNTYTIAAGYFFDGEELCEVDTFTYTYDVTKTAWLVKSEADTDTRTFFDNVQREVQTERKYVLQYAVSQPANSFAYATTHRISSLLSVTPNALDFLQANQGFVALTENFTAVDGSSGLHILKNDYGDVTLVAAFTASSATGTLCTIGAAYRPSVDLWGYYHNGTTLAVFKILANGNIELKNAGTAEGVYNYIQFQFNLNAQFPAIALSRV